MFNDTQTSEPMDTNEDFDLFADDDSDFIEEPTSDPIETEPEQQETEPQEPAQEPEGNQAQTMLDIVYNGQPMQLTKEQAEQLKQLIDSYSEK